MIKVFTTTLNSHGEHLHNVGQRVLHKLIKHVGGFVETSLLDADVVFIGTPIMFPYAFHYKLAEEIGNKPVIVFNESDGSSPESGEPGFREYILDGHNIKAYFLREWFKGYSRPEFKFPLITFALPDYLAAHTAKDDWMKPPQSESEFWARPKDVFHCQSMHVTSRKLFYEAVRAKNSGCWIANDYYENRMPFEEMMAMQGQSKITATLEGSGVVCMRHFEGGINSVLCLHGFQMLETYPWIEGENCLKLPYLSEGGEYNRGVVDVPKAIAYLEGWLQNPKLYEVYVNCVENAAKYSMQHYCENHLAPNILKYL